MKIIVAGKNNIAIQVSLFILKRYPELNLQAIPSNENKTNFFPSFKNFCLINNIKICSLEEIYNDQNIIFLSVEFDKIIDINKFKSKKLFNIHFSLLPSYKGMYTSIWPLINGDYKTGCTLHIIDNGIDTGPIIDQIKFNINDTYRSLDLYLLNMRYGFALFKRNFEKILNNTFNLQDQCYLNSSYYSKNSIDFENLKIDFNQTALNISRQIRAFNFRIYQLPKYKFTNISGFTITNKRSIGKPGSIIHETFSEIYLSTIDFDIILKKDLFNLLLKNIKNEDFHGIEKILNLSPEYSLEYDLNGLNPLNISIKLKKLKAFKKLISMKLSPNLTSIDGSGALLMLQKYIDGADYKKFYEILIDNGASSSLKNIYDISYTNYLK